MILSEKCTPTTASKLKVDSHRIISNIFLKFSLMSLEIAQWIFLFFNKMIDFFLTLPSFNAKFDMEFSQASLQNNSFYGVNWLTRRLRLWPEKKAVQSVQFKKRNTKEREKHFVFKDDLIDSRGEIKRWDWGRLWTMSKKYWFAE